MIKKPTVFVLGAGASQPYGFPLGATLVDQIAAEILDEDSTLVSRLKASGVVAKVSRQFATDLRDARPYSIDAFLEQRPDYLEVGKLAIADVLLRAESQRTLQGTDQRVDWYRYLFNRILASRTENYYLLQAQHLTIVTFNFDRSFERALFLCLRASFGKTDEEIRNLAKVIRIYHIHGVLGQASWLNPSPDATKYGHNTGNVGGATRRAVNSIKLVTEDPESKGVTRDAIAALQKADYVYFIGFGFDERNLLKLRLPVSLGQDVPVHATVLGWSTGEQSEIGRRLGGRRTILRQADAITFLREFAEALFE